jgi:hypothetical protein
MLTEGGLCVPRRRAADHNPDYSRQREVFPYDRDEETALLSPRRANFQRVLRRVLITVTMMTR